MLQVGWVGLGWVEFIYLYRIFGKAQLLGRAGQQSADRESNDDDDFLPAAALSLSLSFSSFFRFSRTWRFSRLPEVDRRTDGPPPAFFEKPQFGGGGRRARASVYSNGPSVLFEIVAPRHDNDKRPQRRLARRKTVGGGGRAGSRQEPATARLQL